MNNELRERIAKALYHASEAWIPNIRPPWEERILTIKEHYYRDADAVIKTMREERPTIVCLCGSTRFSEAFHKANLRETLAGKIVLTVGCDFKSDRDLLLAGELTEADKERLDELHLRKIDLADEILVLNVGGYVGQSTAREIAYAFSHDKRIRYLEPAKGAGA